MADFEVKLPALLKCAEDEMRFVSKLEQMVAEVVSLKGAFAFESAGKARVISDINRLLRDIAEQKSSLTSMGNGAREIHKAYLDAEKRILQNCGSFKGAEITTDDKKGSSQTDPTKNAAYEWLMTALEGLGITNTMATVMIDTLKFVMDLGKFADDLGLDKLADGLSISGFLIDASKDTLENLQTGASTNKVLADLLGQVVMTLGDKAIETGCTAIGSAIGSVVPVLGNAAGGVVGGFVGKGVAAGFDWLMDKDFDNDGKTGSDMMNDFIEDQLDKINPKGKEPLLDGQRIPPAAKGATA